MRKNCFHPKIDIISAQVSDPSRHHRRVLQQNRVNDMFVSCHTRERSVIIITSSSCIGAA